jgi:hypothetical protein
MALIMRSILCLAVIFYVNGATLCLTFAANSNLDDQITAHEPKTRISDLKELPEGKGVNWLWALLGLAVVGGVAAIAGGGGDDGGGDDGDGGDNTGSVGGSW